MGRCAVSTQKQKRPFALRALAAFAGTLAILFVLLLAAYALPGERVRQHVYDSARTIQNEGLYPEYLGFKLFQMDNYTDTLMLFEAASADELPPLQAMMTNTAYNVDNFETLADDLAWYIEKDWSTGAQRTDAPALEPFSYARYWHGYLIWLRPLLLLMPYTGVRIVQYIVLFSLLAVVLVQLRRRCGLRAAVWFAVSQLAVSVWFVPHQVQYFTCFMIAYAGCAWVLAKPRRSDVLCLGLLVLGTATAFCDLLVTPIITLGLPLTCWLLEPQQRLRGGVPQCALAVGGSLCWGTGYALCWAGKWALAGAVTGNNVLADALHQAEVRTTADTWHGMELTWRNIFMLFIRYVKQPSSLLARSRGAGGADCPVHPLHPQQNCAGACLTVGAYHLHDPRMVCAAAHPQHPARLVYLACFGAYRLCRAGISLLRM